jgi:hypothetical protein
LFGILVIEPHFSLIGGPLNRDRRPLLPLRLLGVLRGPRAELVVSWPALMLASRVRLPGLL